MCRSSVRKPDFEPGRGYDSAECPRQRVPRDVSAGQPAGSGILCGWKGSTLGRIFEQSLKKCVLVLEDLNAAHQIINLGFEQLHLLGKLSQGRRRRLRPLEPPGQRSANRRIDDDPHDWNQECHQQDERDDRHVIRVYDGCRAPSRAEAYHASMTSLRSLRSELPYRARKGAIVSTRSWGLLSGRTSARAFAICPNSISCRRFRCWTNFLSMSCTPDKAWFRAPCTGRARVGSISTAVAPRRSYPDSRPDRIRARARTASSGSCARRSLASSVPAGSSRSSRSIPNFCSTRSTRGSTSIPDQRGRANCREIRIRSYTGGVSARSRSSPGPAR